MKDRESSKFFIESWEIYATSVFSWQPAGDTPTRRAFYDSVMFGCIPVIAHGVSEIYAELFQGLAWQDFSIQDVVSTFIYYDSSEATNIILIYNLYLKLYTSCVFFSFIILYVLFVLYI